MGFLKKAFIFHAAAYNVAYTSMYEMVNAPDRQKQSQLIKIWRESTLTQLSHVGLIVSLCLKGSRLKNMDQSPAYTPVWNHVLNKHFARVR